jgi:hypothetical protein
MAADIAACAPSPPRQQAELEAQLVSQEVTRLVEDYIERRVKEVLVSEHVQASLADRLQVGHANPWENGGVSACGHALPFGLCT